MLKCTLFVRHKFLKEKLLDHKTFLLLTFHSPLAKATNFDISVRFQSIHPLRYCWLWLWFSFSRIFPLLFDAWVAIRWKMWLPSRVCIAHCAIIATLSCKNFFSPNRNTQQTNPCWTRWSHWCRLVYLIGFNWSDSDIKCAKKLSRNHPSISNCNANKISANFHCLREKLPKHLITSGKTT